MQLWEGVRLAMQQREFDAELEIVSEEEGPTASLDLGPLGRQSVEDFFKAEAGIELRFEANLGGMTLQMKMPMILEGTELVGSVGDTGGFFTLDYRGITEARAQELEQAGERERLRIRGGPQTTQRTLLKLGDEEVSIRFDTAGTDEAAFALVESLDEGVVRFLLHQSTKLFTDVDLRFGDAVVKTENVAADYPGVYSLWLHKSAGGWSLLFNDKADAWGNQHDPEADAASVPLDFVADADPAAEKLTVELAEADGGGAVKISWGPYRWSTSFSLD